MSRLLLCRLCPALTLLFLVFASGQAAASFHLMTMDELYSNADGSVQFLEMTALAPAQQFFANHHLTVTQGGTTHTFTVPSNLPGDTSGHRVLFATQGFANLGVVHPDYIVPDGFFFAGAGSVNWGEGADVWSYSNLPSDGRLSLNRNGTTGVNSPQNFAGATGSVSGSPPPAQTFNIEGLWWNSPAGSESGWGVNLTQQGDIVFATWFTYDTDGSGMWLVMSRGDKVADNKYSGTLYRTTGPSFDAAPFDPSRVTVTPVGSATFAFTDANNGTFAYTVNGITHAKNITRQVFATPAPTCFEGTAAPGSSPIYGTGTSAGPNYQDLWWRSPAGSESGWGVNITHQGNILFATWFTYDASGKGMWLVMSDGERVGSTSAFTGALYRTTGPAFNAQPWNPAQVVVTPVGSATFEFGDANNGTFTYTVNGVTQSKSITRQVYGTPTTACQ
ncbi:MAG TPA: hypothetical protein VLS49_03405 [Usitatibacter sp.]|nr:hypothetical protein [Usitatibacter sp.]